MDCQILEQTKFLRLRVLSGDRVVYVLYNVDEDKMNFYNDPDFRSQCGLWAWEEKNVASAVRNRLTVPTKDAA
jgi:hypothetical protein